MLKAKEMVVALRHPCLCTLTSYLIPFIYQLQYVRTLQRNIKIYVLKKHFGNIPFYT